MRFNRILTCSHVLCGKVMPKLARSATSATKKCNPEQVRNTFRQIGKGTQKNRKPYFVQGFMAGKVSLCQEISG